MLSVTLINTRTKGNLRRIGFICLIACSLSPRTARSGASVGNWRQMPQRNKYYLLTWLASLAFSWRREPSLIVFTHTVLLSILVLGPEEGFHHDSEVYLKEGFADFHRLETLVLISNTHHSRLPWLPTELDP